MIEETLLALIGQLSESPRWIGCSSDKVKAIAAENKSAYKLEDGTMYSKVHVRELSVRICLSCIDVFIAPASDDPSSSWLTTPAGPGDRIHTKCQFLAEVKWNNEIQMRTPTTIQTPIPISIPISMPAYNQNQYPYIFRVFPRGHLVPSAWIPVCFRACFQNTVFTSFWIESQTLGGCRTRFSHGKYRKNQLVTEFFFF